jgi:hypothetical protein
MNKITYLVGAIGVVVGFIAQNGINYYHKQGVASYLESQGCVDLGPPTNPDHEIAKHISRAFLCPPNNYVFPITK